MEDMIEVYTRPHNPARPFVCLDETSKQLVRRNTPAHPDAAKPAARYDYE
jgi:hypothetical protein